MSNDEIIVPANLYDFHELVSEAYGGIGHTRYHEQYTDGNHPCCIRGQAYFGFVENMFEAEILLNKYCRLYSVMENDSVFNKYKEYRISWQEYCKRRNIVRGEDE